MGDELLKFYVCIYNKWNPYSEEIMNIPEIYWIMAFHLLQIKNKNEWDNKLLPHAELICQLTHPEIYREYAKYKDRSKKQDELAKGQEYYRATPDGTEGGGAANAYYNPALGLVDDDGNVLIPKEKYEEMVGMSGVAISW